jgi:hypothetical protein
MIIIIVCNTMSNILETPEHLGNKLAGMRRQSQKKKDDDTKKSAYMKFLDDSYGHTHNYRIAPAIHILQRILCYNKSFMLGLEEEMLYRCSEEKLIVILYDICNFSRSVVKKRHPYITVIE